MIGGRGEGDAEAGGGGWVFGKYTSDPHARGFWWREREGMGVWGDK